MKKVITVQEVDGQGLEALLDKHVTIWCECYIYSGKLIGVSDTDIILEDAGIVYETGKLNEAGFSDVQMFPCKEWRIRTEKIESYGELK